MAWPSDLPNELVIEILSSLTDRRDLTNASQTNQKLRACASDLFTGTLRLTVNPTMGKASDCWKCLAGKTSRLTLSTSIPISILSRFTHLQIVKGGEHGHWGYHLCEIDLHLVPNQLPRLQYLSLQIPVAGARLPYAHKMKGLELDFELWALELGGDEFHTNIQALPLRTARPMLNPTLLCSVQNLSIKYVKAKASIQMFNDAIRRLILSPRSLDIKTLELDTIDSMCFNSVATLVSAIKALKNVSIRNRDVFEGIDAPGPARDPDKLFKAIHRHEDSLRNFTYLDWQQKSGILFYTSPQIGRQISDWDLRDFSKVYTAVLPLFPFGLESNMLPRNLKVLQLKVPLCFQDGWKHMFDPMMNHWRDNLKVKTLRSLRHLVLWDPHTTTDLHSEIRQAFLVRWEAILRSQGVRFEVCEIEELEDTPFGSGEWSLQAMDGGEYG